MKRTFSAQQIVLCGMIAAVYTALTVLLKPLSFGGVQFRLAEALTVLPVIMPQTVPALGVGCLLGNLLGGGTLLDIIFGTAATLFAAMLTAKHKNPLLGAIYPAVINAVVIGAVLTASAGAPSAAVFFLSAGGVLLGQVGACFGLGVPLVYLLGRVPTLKPYMKKTGAGQEPSRKEHYE